MAQEYTPPGSAQAYTVPQYGDVLDGEVAFKALVDDIAAAVGAEIAARAAAVAGILDGATFTGEVDVVSATATGSTSARQITISTSAPSGGADGDLWVVYVP